MMNPNQLFLSAAGVRRALPMGDAMESMRAAFGTLTSGDARVLLRSSVEVPGQSGRLLLMPSGRFSW